MTDELDDILRGARRYRRTSRVQATRLTEERRWRTSRGSPMDAAAGDWLLTDGADQWTVTADVFADTYRRQSDGTYAKPSAVEAVRLRTPVEVPTLEGSSRAACGDWLLRGENGEMWPVTDAHFRSHYEPVT